MTAPAVIKAALLKVQAGEREFTPSDKSPEEEEAFQELAYALLEAKQLDLVHEAKVQRSRMRETYNHAVRVIVPGGLTPKRKSYLSNAPAHGAANEESTAKMREPEVFQLKPTLWGVGIDLKALWKRLKAFRTR